MELTGRKPHILVIDESLWCSRDLHKAIEELKELKGLEEQDIGISLVDMDFSKLEERVMIAMLAGTNRQMPPLAVPDFFMPTLCKNTQSWNSLNKGKLSKKQRR